jgi:WD40 repeat protein
VATTGRLVAAGGFGATPHVFDVATGAELSRPPRPTHGPNALAVLGGELLIGCDSGSVLAVGLGTGDTRELRLGESPILSLTTHGGSMYAGTYGGQVISSRGRADVGAPVPALCATDHGVVAGTYNGDLIALGGHPFGIRDTGPPHAGSVKSLAAVPGGFLSASTDRTVATGNLHDRAPLWEHGNLVNAVATLGGTIVATASRDHTVKVARRDRPGPIQTLLGPGESVKCVALLGDPDCPTVLAGSYDFGLYAWRIDWDDSAAALRSGRLIAEFGQGLSCMAPIGDGSVAVAGWDGRILVLDRGLQTTHEFAVPELLRRAGQAVAA